MKKLKITIDGKEVESAREIDEALSCSSQFSGSAEIKCRACGWLGKCDDVLTGDHPFQKGCHVYGCPECGEIAGCSGKELMKKTDTKAEQTVPLHSLVLPCPFCGGRAVACNSYVPTDRQKLIGWLGYAECTKCGVRLERASKGHARRAWNRRQNAEISFAK